jgi:hypothetical protein
VTWSNFPYWTLCQLVYYLGEQICLGPYWVLVSAICRKLTWSGLCRLDPIVNFPLGLTWSIPADWILCQFGFYIQRFWFTGQTRVHAATCHDPLYIQRFYCLFTAGTRGLTWSSPFRLGPGVSMVPVQVWLGPVFQIGTWFQFGLLGGHVYTQPRVMTL